MAFPLTPVSLIIGTSDGILLKVDKAKRMRYLLKNQLSREKPGEKPLVIEDENVLFCALKVYINFKENCLKLFGMVYSKTCDIIFSTDTYHLDSLKSMER